MARRVEGPCRLCGTVGLLRDGHILPKWFYRRAVADVPAPAQPILIQDGVAVATNEQLTEHLLCATCEQKFGVWENLVSQLTVQTDGSFPLLAATKPVVVGPPIRVRTDVRDASTLDVASISAFGLSVIWRSGISSKRAKASLGGSQSTLLTYLAGQSALPDDVFILLTLVQDVGLPGLERVATMPKTEAVTGIEWHWFHCFGLRFDLFVGAEVAALCRGICFLRTGRVSIGVPPDVISALVASVAEATPRGKRLRTSRKAP